MELKSRIGTTRLLIVVHSIAWVSNYINKYDEWFVKVQLLKSLFKWVPFNMLHFILGFHLLLLLLTIVQVKKQICVSLFLANISLRLTYLCGLLYYNLCTPCNFNPTLFGITAQSQIFVDATLLVLILFSLSKHTSKNQVA
jgi:hypothetical protein